jgi:hypothetical protein
VSRLHGLHEYVNSFWDNTFSSVLWQGLCRLVGIELTPGTLIPSVGCETRHIRFPVVISVAQLGLVGMRHSGLLVWMWVPGTHLIGPLHGPFHFSDAPRGNDGVHALWEDRFSLSIPRIEYDNGLANFDSTNAHLQEMIHSSWVGSSRHYNLGFQEWRLQSRHEGQPLMIRVVQHQLGEFLLRLAWDPGISGVDSLAAGTIGRVSFYQEHISIGHWTGFLGGRFYVGCVDIMVAAGGINLYM